MEVKLREVKLLMTRMFRNLNSIGIKMEYFHITRKISSSVSDASNLNHVPGLRYKYVHYNLPTLGRELINCEEICGVSR